MTSSEEKSGYSPNICSKKYIERKKSLLLIVFIFNSPHDKGVNMKEFICECYKEYIKFMNIESDILPNINPILQNTCEQYSGKSLYAYINYNEIENNPINLYYSQILYDYHKTFQKAILFHEFTHILDGINFLSIYKESDLASIMATYSEYHAAQIELACKVGFRSIHSCYKINLSKTYVYTQNKKIKIETDYIHSVSDALSIIDEPNDAYYKLNEYDYFLNYKTFESKTMYYLGKKNFCQQYSLKKIPDLTSAWYKSFYSFIENIENDIVNKNYNALISDRKKLWEKYISYFPYSKIDSLLAELSTF